MNSILGPFKVNLEANTGGEYKYLTGYLIADNISKDSVALDKIKSLKNEEMLVMDWNTMFEAALSQWREFLRALSKRDPKDERLKTLLEDFE